MTSAAYNALTAHQRAKTGAHRFSYSLFYLLLDLDTVDRDIAGLRFLSRNKFNLFSFHDRDHADGKPLRAWSEHAFAEAGVDVAGGRIEILALPRVLGFVFNPISLLFGYDKNGVLAGVIYEVRNTFGEMHTYVTPYRAGEKQRVRKVFHVSPFFDVQGEYRFQVQPPNERLALVVENITDGALEHVATLNGRRVRLSDVALLRAFFALPLMTIGVVASIHWQALKLWLRGARYRPKPAPPQEAFSYPEAIPLHLVPSPSPSPEPSLNRIIPMSAVPIPEKIETASAGLIAAVKGAPASAKAVMFACLAAKRGTLELRLPGGRALAFGGSEAGPTARIEVRDYAFARQVLTAGDIGFADAYIAGHWDTPDLSAVLEFFSLNADAVMPLVRGNWLVRAINMLTHIRRDNNREGARRNIHEHYDLGNRFYAAWLDPTMTYSSACFEPGDDLTMGQINKYRALADKLQLKPGEHVLEIGCGWGGFAEVAARDYGARVTGLTISNEQLSYARDRMARAGLSDSVDIKLLDYRDAEGAFDKIASIEMFEAVGERYWPSYFAKVSSLLKPGGRAAFQIITIKDDLFASYRSRADFIQRYIFPGGMLPSLSRLQEEAAHAGLAWEPAHRFGQHYADTLAAWGQRFTARWEEIRTLGFDDKFKRLWRFYLSYCEAGFRTARTDVVQVALAKA